MIDIVKSYSRVQFQGKFMIQTHQNGEKSHFEPDLGVLGTNSGRQIFISKI